MNITYKGVPGYLWAWSDVNETPLWSGRTASRGVEGRLAKQKGVSVIAQNTFTHSPLEINEDIS